MEANAKDRFMREICRHAGIEEFRELVYEMVEIISSNGFSVCCRNDIDQSVIEWSNYLIRIYVPINPSRNLGSLWSLLHETGHLVNGNNGPSKQSELEAWKFAQNIVERSFPDLVKMFLAYKDNCLKSYGVL